MKAISSVVSRNMVQVANRLMSSSSSDAMVTFNLDAIDSGLQITMSDIIYSLD